MNSFTLVFNCRTELVFTFQCQNSSIYFIVPCLLGGHPFTCVNAMPEQSVAPRMLWFLKAFGPTGMLTRFVFLFFLFCILIWGYREFLLNISYCKRTGMRHEIYIKIIYWIESKITISDADIVRKWSWRAARNGNCACLYGHHHLGSHFRIR